MYSIQASPTSLLPESFSQDIGVIPKNIIMLLADRLTYSSLSSLQFSDGIGLEPGAVYMETSSIAEDPKPSIQKIPGLETGKQKSRG